MTTTATSSTAPEPRRTAPSPVLRAVRRVRQQQRALRTFRRHEMVSPVRLSAPGRLLRGYESDRRWLYPARPSRSAGYVDDVTYRRLAPSINPAAVQEMFVDKAAFDRALRERDLDDATPHLLATVDDGEVTRHRDWSGPVALKLADGLGGRGFALYPGLDEALVACPSSGSYLVQEQVVAHPYGAELFPGALNTLRVLALRAAPGEPPRIPVVVQKIGRTSSAPVDAVSRGGLVAAVDLTTGALGRAVGAVIRRGRDEWDVHPDTGARITGRVVPMLQDVLDLVTRAMDAFPDALHVGWDVAVSERGPLLIEGNATQPAIWLVQAHGPFAAAPAVRETYERWGLLPRSRR